MRSFFLHLAALVLAVSGLVACGDDVTTDAGGSTSPSDSTATTTTTTRDGSTTSAAPTTSGTDGGSASSSGETTTTQAVTTSSTSGGSTTIGPIGGPYPVAELAIVVTHPDQADVAYTISCLGDTASITGGPVAIDEQAACLALAEPAVVERLTTDPGQRICTQQFGGSDQAMVAGTIDEVAVEAAVNRKDGCGIDDWDVILADILPAAVGLG